MDEALTTAVPVPSSGCVPTIVLPTLNVTEPVGTPALYLRLITEVRVTALSLGTVVGETEREVWVAAMTVTFTGALVEV